MLEIRGSVRNPGIISTLRARDIAKAWSCRPKSSKRSSAPDIKIRHVGNCAKADPGYGEGVAAALGIPVSEGLKGQ